MRLEKEYTKIGQFWLPCSPNIKVSGILKIENGGRIELELLGGTLEGDQDTLEEDDSIKIILGQLEDNNFITLVDCFYIISPSFFSEIPKSKLHIHQAFEGVKYNKTEDILINSLSFTTDCINEWLDIKTIKNESNFKEKTCNITITSPIRYSYPLNNGMVLEIHINHRILKPSISETNVTQCSYFKLVSKQPKHFEDFKKIAYRITCLLCFAIDDIACLQQVVADSENIKDDSGNNIKINIYYPSLPFVDRQTIKNRHQMLFRFTNILNNAKNVFNNWIDSYEKLSPAFSLYFLVKSNNHKFLDGKFLTLAQCLETYHRRTSDEKLMENEAFIELVSLIKENCPQDNLDWLNGRLHHGNEIPLRKRIQRLIEPHKKYTSNTKNRNKFIKKITDTRNFMTHYDPILETDIAKGIDLWTLTQKMEAIFQLNLLTEIIGFNDDQIEGIVGYSFSLKEKLPLF